LNSLHFPAADKQDAEVSELGLGAGEHEPPSRGVQPLSTEVSNLIMNRYSVLIIDIIVTSL
jgi:hypothetical protein